MRTHASLTRPKQAMPLYVRKALNERALMTTYRERPTYQQNDYLWWIRQAKKEDTRERRLTQMLDELDKGGVYMGMKHAESAKK